MAPIGVGFVNVATMEDADAHQTERPRNGDAPPPRAVRLDPRGAGQARGDGGEQCGGGPADADQRAWLERLLCRANQAEAVGEGEQPAGGGEHDPHRPTPRSRPRVHPWASPNSTRSPMP